MKITIFGYGFVGRAHEMALSVHKLHDITIVDPAHNKNKIGNPEAVIIAVSTPMSSSKDGHCDMSNVFNVLDQCPAGIPILIKSTISLEGWDYIQGIYPDHEITFSPEFLRAEHALEDINNRESMYFGGGDDLFWASLFWKQGCEMFRRDPKELIVMKYTVNSFLAAKVAFFNQIYDLCEEAGINYNIVKDLVSRDERIGDSHMTVTEERGFGGHCFPKDTSAFMKSASQLGVDLSILRNAYNYNQVVRNKKLLSEAMGDGIQR
jgi:UDPglucose 6-dehydrogenase